MTNLRMFSRHLNNVHNAADVIIQKRNAKARWPVPKEDVGIEDGKCIVFAKPAVLWNVPLRKTGPQSRTRRAILIDGRFDFSGDVFSSGGVHLEVYKTTNMEDGSLEMTLLDTMHFDFESSECQTAFHPMFHVQFGKAKQIDQDVIAEIVCELGNLHPDKLVLDRNLDTPTRDLRIPTPQMDYMSVLAMVIADHFCNENWSKDVNSGFVKLLRQVMHADNPARYSTQSQKLERRWNPVTKGPFCASHWYAESH